MRARVLIVVLSVFAAWPTGLAIAAPILSISPSPTLANVGDTFSLNIDIADVTDLYVYQFDLSFDPALLQVVPTGVGDIVEGPFLGTGGPTFFIPGAIDLITLQPVGLLSLTASSLLGVIPGVTGGGTLATVTFLALAQGPSSIDFRNLDFRAGVVGPLLDTDGNPVLDANGDPELTVIESNITFAQVNGGLVEVATPVTPVPEPATMLLVGTGLAVAARKRLARARANRSTRA